MFHPWSGPVRAPKGPKCHAPCAQVASSWVPCGTLRLRCDAKAPGINASVFARRWGWFDQGKWRSSRGWCHGELTQVEPAQGGWRKFPGSRTVTLQDPKTRFAYRRCSGPLQFLNSVLWIRPLFASPLFTCDHHFFSSSHTISALLNSQNSFQQLSFFFRLFPPQLNSFHLFPALLNDSHLCPPLLNSSHLLPPLLNSSHLFSPPLNSSQPFSPLVNSSQLLPALLNSPHLFSQRCFTQGNLYTQKLLHTDFFHRQVVSQILHSKLLHRETFAHSKLLHTANFYTQQTFTQRNCYTGCAKMEKFAAKAPFATLMQLLQYGLRFSAAKQNSIPHAAAAARNHAAAIPLRSANTELQRNFRTTATEMAAPNRISTPKRKKHDFKALFKRIYSFNGISSSPKWRNICLSRVRNLHAATTIQFTSLSC